jgi:threonine/homoserine/homoserine lactone efflux protein
MSSLHDPLLWAFVLASLVLAVTPGPVVLFVVARTVSQGRLVGVASVAGAALGNLFNAVGAALGLAALFAVSSLAFTVVKWAGAAYLVGLGIKALKRKPVVSDAPTEFEAPRLSRIFRDGFLVALLNPKTTIFFAAFLPQFLHPGSGPLESVLLGALFVLIAASTDCLYVLLAGAASRLFRGRGTRGADIGRYATAATFIGLGVFTAASGSRATTR